MPDEVTVEGGGAPSVSSTQQLTVSGEPLPFGVQSYELVAVQRETAHPRLRPALTRSS